MHVIDCKHKLCDVINKYYTVCRSMVCEKYNPLLLFSGSRKTVDPRIGIFLSPLNTGWSMMYSFLSHIPIDLPAHGKDIRKTAAHWHHTFMHTHTPIHNLRLWPKCPPLAFSMAEMSVAEMSGPKRPGRKCRRLKCPTFV